jgi:hypothetical protein
LDSFFKFNGDLVYDVVEFASAARRDIFLEAVLLWIVPFFAALSIIDCA